MTQTHAVRSYVIQDFKFDPTIRLPSLSLLTIPERLLTESSNPAEVGKVYRTKAVPDTITDAQLGLWYLNRNQLLEAARGANLSQSLDWPSTGNSCLPRWTVFRNPDDYPKKFVARLFVFGCYPSPAVYIGRSLHEVRKYLPLKMKRWNPKILGGWDQKYIVEQWV